MQTYYTPAHHQLDLAQEGSYTPPGADSTAFELPYRTPLPNALNLDNPSGYEAPPAYIVAFPADYQTPAHDQLHLDCPAGYAAPAADACNFGFPVLPPEFIGLSINATAPASTTQIRLSVLNPGTTLSINAAGPASSLHLQINPTAPATRLSINAHAPSSQSQIRIDAEVPVYPISINATGQAATVSIRVEWGQRIPGASLTTEGGGFGTRMGWNDAPSKPQQYHGQWQNAERVNQTTGSTWEDAQRIDSHTDLPHNQMQQLDGTDQLPWGTFDSADRDNQQGYTQPPALDLRQAKPWGDFEHTPAAEPQSQYIYPPAKDRGQQQPWFSTELFQPRTYWVPAPPKEWPPLQPGTYTQAATGADLDCPSGYDQPQPSSYLEWTNSGQWQRWHYRNVNFGEVTEEDVTDPVPWPPNPVEANRPSDSAWVGAHDQMQHSDLETEHPWGAGSWSRPTPDYGWDGGWDNEQPEPAERPQQPIIHEVYLFMPNITLYRLPDGTEFEATQCVWSTDRDSWGWRFTANLKRDADLAIIKPTSNGLKEIACEINGHTFTALVESYGRNRQHGNTGYTISGRSRTAWLSDPHAPLRSKALTAAYSAAALAEQELANTGFSLQWNAQDWLIPAGSYSYNQLNPISAIKRLAEAAGYMLQSHPELKQLIVSPRYRVDPHNWSQPTTALDAILPSDFIIQESGGFREKPAYNRAIVTGGLAGGVIVTVTRDGTAGDILAPMATDDLITHSDVGYQRCRALIAEGGTWEEMNITTMLTQSGQAPGLLLPGHLVEIQDTDDTYPVIIDGTSITATSSDTEIKVRQQLGVQRRMA
ncbi:hypothetical protein [Marinobacterium sp. BA1]|uniref:hypothetical protein n=1 Tax=Marinobacterium sp. BA1 TaxID=3138931 RepID=UPI0032E69253